MSYDVCEGCGRELLSAEPWEFKGTMYFTPEERERYENEEIRFKQDHPDCHAGAWTIQGSLTKHCFKCCPPAPFRKLVRPSNDVLARMAEAQRKLFGK
jgi:hypothetical protein